MKRRGAHRGGAPALVLCLYLAMGSVLLGAVSLAGAGTAAAERDYRRSQAAALAEAGVTEAQAGLPPHGERPLGSGTYRWSEAPVPGGRAVTARGAVRAASGALVTRMVRAVLVRAGTGWRVVEWREGP